MYTTPDGHYFRIHHIRPRFKNEVENVLGYIAFSIAQTGRQPTGDFKSALCTSIRQYGTNATSKQKTIDNWRTEIGALFGMYIEKENGYTIPTRHTIELANTSDIQKFFMGFVYSFQYPGGHLKPNAISEMVAAGISFHPYRWLFRALLNTDLHTIDKRELCHCVLNDKRVTRDHEEVALTANRIIGNRHRRESYDSSGDVVRYAADLLDYAMLAGLLDEHNGRFSLNESNRDIAKTVADSNNFFGEYNSTRPEDVRTIGLLERKWFEYVEKCHDDMNTKRTGVLAGRTRNNQDGMTENIVAGFAIRTDNCDSTIDGAQNLDVNSTAQIGDHGENIVMHHECLRVSNDGRGDLVHLIKRIPTHYAVGYDVKSVETDTEFERLIEVKTTNSISPLTFRQFHLTTNEWRTAQSRGNQYYVYRLMISAGNRKLFVIRDPVQKFRDNLVTIIPRDGVDMTFSEAAGEEVELLCTH